MNERVLHTPRERLSETGSEEISRPEPHMSSGTPVYCWVEVLQRGEKGEGGGIESMYLMGVVLDGRNREKDKTLCWYNYTHKIYEVPNVSAYTIWQFTLRPLPAANMTQQFPLPLSLPLPHPKYNTLTGTR